MDSAAIQTGPKPDGPKRRACDECRTRKLACSKEPDGCARCKREDIRCYYSPQKPMGRPRKLPHVHMQAESGKEDRQVVVPVDNGSSNKTIDMDLDMAFLDVNDISFLDLLPDLSSDLNGFNQSFDLSSSAQQSTGVNTNYSPTSHSPPMWRMGSHLASNINFDTEPETHTHTEQISLEQAARLISEVPEQMPGLSPNSSTSNSDHADHVSPHEPATPTYCGCLPGLYLALDSLTHLPTELGAAMRVARTAAKTAHDTILCQICGSPPLELTLNPPIQTIQNMMMLGALLPSISSAYKTILKMVDGETEKAIAERRQIVFTLDSYGGLWGKLGALDTECGLTSNIDGAAHDPHLWRLTVRALLKYDVYGLDCDPPGGSCSKLSPGLKDIIAMMEERSRKRHEQIDALVATGYLNADNACGYISLHSGDKPTCMRIIDIAKKSMQDLIIP